NYSIYLPNPTCSSVVGEQLQWSESLSEVLADLGLRTKLESNGLFVAGEKVSGTAQTRRWGMLHHGTLLLSENELFHRMDHFLKAGRRNYDRDGEGSNGVTSKPARVNYLKVLSGKTINISHLIDRWVKQVAYRLNARPEKGHLSSSEIALAKRLRDFKYGTQKWTVDPRSIENST
ncbi:MAG: lipoate--protein ligase family protein, partial [Candidatus Bipolaricaulota bacterium]